MRIHHQIDVHLHGDIHVYYHNDGLENKIDSLIQNTSKMATDQEQAIADLQAISTQLKKIGTESSASLAKITALEEAANNQPGLTPELKAAIADVKSQAQVVDDLVPDAIGDGTTTTTEPGGATNP